MNTRARTMLQPKKVPVKPDKGKVEKVQGNKQGDATKAATKIGQASSTERKIALQQDVDKLKKKLRYEENVHRALERAFNRPLGALPRLPPYLPAATLELLAEVAVLEEEVVRLEERVVHFRQDLYQEAVYISSSKKNVKSFADFYDLAPNKSPKPEHAKTIARNLGASTTYTISHLPSFSEDEQGKKNQLCTNSVKQNKSSSIHKAQTSRTPEKRPPVDDKLAEKHLNPQKLQIECRAVGQGNAEARNVSTADEMLWRGDNPNKISEDILKCLSSIFLRMSSTKSRRTAENLPFLSTLVSQENGEETEYRDPYGFYLGNLPLSTCRTSPIKKAFLEYGIPESPEMIVELMPKATISVGGHLLNAITIEHFILRLPYHSKYTSSRVAKNDEMTVRSKFGLELSEPLVTFALSCGSWSSPAVRVYTASQIENELDVAKREYLQAAVGISSRKFAIPKLLDWYLLDFAKDLESLLDWICLQIPSELGKEAIKCLERGKLEPHSQIVQIMPYEFTFRYLLYTS
ncbi:hypothetical protein GH714_013796 [Hevea brasiliensis]|uniref:Ternary complex factor MIP1 leucine-zipper domain-containing protein n=1 Tax=Hevea brasiliensis TaxID=3981 RepID=A0A6A6NH23_HEVBR|nr:hypothetical protein GH714_013796 [Hevea brasiliensis]